VRRAAAFIVAATLGAACSSGGGDTAPSTTATATATNNGTGPGTTDPTTAASTTTNDLPSTGDDDLDALVARARTATYHVVYEDAAGLPFEIYRAGDRLVLFTDDQALYQLDDGASYACELGEASRCASLAGAGSIVDGMLSTFFGAFASVIAGSEDADSPFVDATISSNVRIAGREARCVDVVTPDGGYSVCIDVEIGILLSAAATDGTSTTASITAVDVETDVDPAIFELPADPSAEEAQ